MAAAAILDNFEWPYLNGSRSTYIARGHFCDSIAFLFSVRQHNSICLARYMLSPVRLSVRHTCGSHKTVKDRIMKFSSYVSPIPLVFLRDRLHPEIRQNNIHCTPSSSHNTKHQQLARIAGLLPSG